MRGEGRGEVLQKSGRRVGTVRKNKKGGEHENPGVDKI